MRRLNIKFLAGLIVGVIVLGTSAYGLREFQKRRTAKTLLTRAALAEQQGDLIKAESFLRQYIAYTPLDVDALIKYGEVLKKGAKTPEERKRVLDAYTQVIRLDRSRRDIRRRIVDLAMDPDLRGEVDPRPHLEELLKGSPKNGELEFLLARCEESADRYDKAIALYRKTIADSPKNIDAYIRLADLLRTRTKDPAGSDKVMSALIAANGESGRAHQVKADFEVTWKLEGVEKDLARARELEPDDAAVLLSSARFELSRERGDLNRAREYLARAVARNPQDAEIYEAAFLVELRAKNPQEAEARLRTGLKALDGRDDEGSIGGRIKLNWGLAEALIERIQFEEVVKVVDDLKHDKVRPELTQFLEARIAVAREDWNDAIKILEDVAPKLSRMELSDLSKRSLLLLGACYERAGRPDQQYSAFRRVVNLDPSDIRARIGLASSLNELGKIDEAIDEFRKVVVKEPRVGIDLARLLIRRNLQAPVDQRNWAEVKQTLDQTESAVPGIVEIPILRSEISFEEGHPEDARLSLREASKTHPKNVEPWIGLANLAMRQKAFEQVLPVLDEAVDRLGDRVELRLARAQYWAFRGKVSDRKPLAALGEGLDRFDDQSRRVLLLGLADAHLRLGDVQDATKLLTRVAGERKNDLRSRLILFDLALRSNDPAAIDRAVREIKAAEGEQGVFWRYAKARQLIRQAKPGDKASMTALDEARRLLTPVAARQPSWSRVALSEAEIDELMGNQDGAIKNYLRAILDLGERDVATIQRAVQLLYDRRRYREADVVLRKLGDRDDSMITDELQRLGALVSLRTGGAEHAVDLARKAVDADPNDPRNHILLGQSLWVLGRRPDAEASLRRATTLAPERPEAWVALVEFLASDDEVKAKEAIREAQAKLPKEQANATLARCYERTGQADQAKEAYEAALRANPDDIASIRDLVGFHLRMNQVEDAKRYLRQIIASKTFATQDLKSASQTLATLLSISGNQREVLEAMTILGIRNADQPVRATADEPAEDLRAKARVLALQKLRARRQDAIKILEDLGDREPLTTDDRHLLSQLYELDGNWSKARDQMRSVIVSGEMSPSYSSYLSRYADRFLIHDEPAEAAACVDAIKKVEPTSLKTIHLEARVRKSQGSIGEGVALLREYARAHGEETGRIASMLEDLGAVGPAEELYRSAADQAKKYPPLLALAGFLARQNRAREAIDVLERVGKDCPPAVLADAGVAVLYAAKAEPELARRVEAWTEKGSQTAQSLFNQANLLILEGKTREAEVILRRCIEFDAKNSGPFNNLAWLLALDGGKPAEALELVNRAIALEGPVPGLLDTRAIVYMKLGRAADAIKDLSDAVVLSPATSATAPLYLRLAMANAMVKDTRGRDEALRKATGLKLDVAGLHPLERKEYKPMLDLLARK